MTTAFKRLSSDKVQALSVARRSSPARGEDHRRDAAWNHLSRRRPDPGSTPYRISSPPPATSGARAFLPATARPRCRHTRAVGAPRSSGTDLADDDAAPQRGLESGYEREQGNETMPIQRGSPTEIVNVPGRACGSVRRRRDVHRSCCWTRENSRTYAAKVPSTHKDGSIGVLNSIERSPVPPD